jgi:uncharacterized protein (DUF1684 family)
MSTHRAFKRKNLKLSFLTFDLSSGNESWEEVHRFKIPKGNTIAIDFNTVQPYCFHPKYSCPIVPLENDLNMKQGGCEKYHN